MKKIFLLGLLSAVLVSFITGCRLGSARKSVQLDRDILNQFTLDFTSRSHRLESAHILDALQYTLTQINQQAEEKWTFVINQDEGDIRAIPDDELKRWFPVKLIIKNQIRAGDLLEFLTTQTFTQYELRDNVIVISRQIHN